MYQNKLVACLKSNGKVLREFKDTVYIPFGSEYSVLLKNLNNVRALVNVSIDGSDVAEGSAFVLGANQSLEISRFIRNGNLTQGNSFKFIERTGAVERGRGGIQLDDGIIRIEFQFERPTPVYRPSPTPYFGSTGTPKLGSDYFSTAGFADFINNAPIGGSLQSSSMLRGIDRNDTFTAVASASASVPTGLQNDAGVTVAGSVSDQKFSIASSFATESETHVIVLKLLGETEAGVQIVKPVEVKTKPVCSTCHKVNKATAKFCSECGTSLTIV